MDALETDLYQLTMAAGYFHRGMTGATATCEMFVRRLPKRRTYLVAMGIARLVDWLEHLRFEPDQIDYLATVPSIHDAMTPAFRDYLAGLRFTGDLDAVPEGTIVFESEPILRVRAPIVEAQLAETFLLSAINHATMIATKAARMVEAAKGAGLMEFGTRRTHPKAAIDSARDAYAAGFAGTSNVAAGKRYGIPVMGTAAHMWTMAHPTEEEAFASYVEVFPNASILLIDTYDTVRGAERAATIAREKLKGVRLDSGDLDALSRAVRKVLDDHGCRDTQIVASGDLNEDKIAALVARGAPIDLYGVGTDLVTSSDSPSLGGVYKLVELERDGKTIAVAKFSEGKTTLPGAHQVHRFHDAAGRLERDVIALTGETHEGSESLLVPHLAKGRRVRAEDGLDAVRSRVARGLASLPPELHDLDPKGPSRSPVSISAEVASLIERVRDKVHAEGAKR